MRAFKVALKTIADQTGFLAKGIMRPLLAMLGGFSADLVYTIMKRLVETFESLFPAVAVTVLTLKGKKTNPSWQMKRPRPK